MLMQVVMILNNNVKYGVDQRVMILSAFEAGWGQTGQGTVMPFWRYYNRAVSASSGQLWHKNGQIWLDGCF
jgi:hypothetical protein